jgi:CelD/BcsL family acetyltransferase involved in cellulose biosynthesis
MKVTVCRPTELGPAELDAWHAFQRMRGLTNPFLSPEFASAVDAVYPDARVAVVEDGQTLVGFLPYMARPFRTATAIGGDMSNVQAFVHADGVWPISAVVRAARLNLIELHSLVASQVSGARGVHPTQSFVIDVSDGFPAYVTQARLSGGSFVKEAIRKQRRLERQDPDSRFEIDVDDPHAIEMLCAWKSAQYRRTGQRDRIARPGVRELVERIACASGEGLRGCVSVLRSEGRLVSVGLALRSETTLAGWLSAYDVAAASASPGVVRWLHLIEAASNDGVIQIDLSTGEMEYKRRLSNALVELASCWVGRPSLGCLVGRAAHGPPELARRFVVSRPRAGGLVNTARLRIGSLRGTAGVSSVVTVQGGSGPDGIHRH